MARVGGEIRLQERAARSRLKVRNLPYWRSLSEGFYVGYYKGKRQGTWFVRYRMPGEGEQYKRAKLGEADDAVPADGRAILSWAQAFEKANEWLNRLRDLNLEQTDLKMTVRDVVEKHIKDRDERDSARVGRTVRSTASFKLGAHVLSNSKLAATKLSDLNEVHLRDWQRGLKGMKATTKVRVISELKAALNAVFEERRRHLPADFGVTVKHGLKPISASVEIEDDSSRVTQVIDDDTVRNLVLTAKMGDVEGDFALLVLLLAATGARFSQLVRLRVQDVQYEANRLMVPPSAKGRGKVKAYIRTQIDPDVMAELQLICRNRPKNAYVLERWLHKQVGPAKWERTERVPWKTPSEMRRPWAQLASLIGRADITPYCLRHTSIVRGLKMRLPIRLVASNHDTSVMMIERHYARWITDDLEELSARAIVKFFTPTGAEEGSKSL